MLAMFLGGSDKSRSDMHINYHGNEIHYFIVYMHALEVACNVTETHFRQLKISCFTPRRNERLVERCRKHNQWVDKQL